MLKAATFTQALDRWLSESVPAVQAPAHRSTDDERWRGRLVLQEQQRAAYGVYLRLQIGLPNADRHQGAPCSSMRRASLVTFSPRSHGEHPFALHRAPSEREVGVGRLVVQQSEAIILRQDDQVVLGEHGERGNPPQAGAIRPRGASRNIATA